LQGEGGAASYAATAADNGNFHGEIT
jgi:hypothetical protein